jgi:hypothetical protein
MNWQPSPNQRAPPSKVRRDCAAAPAKPPNHSYHMPMFKYKGTLIILPHIRNIAASSCPPVTSNMFKDELSRYQTSKGITASPSISHFLPAS